MADVCFRQDHLRLNFLPKKQTSESLPRAYTFSLITCFRFLRHTSAGKKRGGKQVLPLLTDTELQMAVLWTGAWAKFIGVGEG